MNPVKSLVTRGGKRWRVVESTDDVGGRGTRLFDLFTETEGGDCGYGGTCSVVLAFYDKHLFPRDSVHFDCHECRFITDESDYHDIVHPS